MSESSDAPGSPPAMASSRAQSAYGCVMAGALIGVFLLAGLLSLVLPIPRQFEGLRDPIAIGGGIGGVVVVALLGMVPLLLFRQGERKRMDTLFGALEMTGQTDAGHGAEYRGTWKGRTRSASVSLDGASPVSRHTRASFGLDADTGTRMVWTRRGSPYMQVWSPPGARHVLLLDRLDVDARSTHPELARELANDPTFWDDLQALMAGIGEAESLVTVGPDHLMLRVDGDGATLFDAHRAQQIYELLERLARAVEARKPTDTPAQATQAWADLAHGSRKRMRRQQWATSLGCLTVVVLGWLAWVAAVILEAM
jgi:hypothetical protein